MISTCNFHLRLLRLHSKCAKMNKKITNSTHSIKYLHVNSAIVRPVLLLKSHPCSLNKQEGGLVDFLLALPRRCEMADIDFGSFVSNYAPETNG